MSDASYPAMPREITIGDTYAPAMKITDPAEARAYFEACVEHCMSFGKVRAEAEAIERSNLGYYAGYYDAETAGRVLALYGADHPIFGTTRPTPQEAYDAGIRLAQGEMNALAGDVLAEHGDRRAVAQVPETWGGWPEHVASLQILVAGEWRQAARVIAPPRLCRETAARWVGADSS